MKTPMVTVISAKVCCLNALLGLTLLLLLSACTDPETSSESAAAIKLEVDPATRDKLNESANVTICFNNGVLNASAYWYNANALSPADWGGNPDPLFRSPLVAKADGNYSFNTIVRNSTRYQIAIVCGVDRDSATGGEELTYLSHKLYIAKISSTASLIDWPARNAWEFDAENNRINTHMDHDESAPFDFGIVCDYCHFFDSTRSFLVSNINHIVLADDCLLCHSGVTPTARDMPIDHVPDIVQLCSDCHFSTIWKPTKL